RASSATPATPRIPTAIPRCATRIAPSPSAVTGCSTALPANNANLAASILSLATATAPPWSAATGSLTLRQGRTATIQAKPAAVLERYVAQAPVSAVASVSQVL